jgi:hypothetical protein
MSGMQQWTSPRQKSVPMPRSLTELQQVAALQFHHCGRLRVYRDGREVTSQAGLKDLQDDELMQVQLDNRGLAVGRQTPIRTTHQAAFIDHGDTYLNPLKPAGSDDDSTLTQQSMGKRFFGQSAYATDYRRFSRAAQPILHKPGDTALFPEPPNASMGQSTYAQQFHGYECAVPAQAQGSDYASILTSLSKGHTFAGQTSYAQSYPPRQPVPPIRVCMNDNDSTLTDAVLGQPLEGQSSYQDHFVRHSLADRQVSARPPRGVPENKPFAGCSEYRNQFIRRSERSPRLRLELI